MSFLISLHLSSLLLKWCERVTDWLTGERCQNVQVVSWTFRQPINALKQDNEKVQFAENCRKSFSLISWSSLITVLHWLVCVFPNPVSDESTTRERDTQILTVVISCLVISIIRDLIVFGVFRQRGNPIMNHLEFVLYRKLFFVLSLSVHSSLTLELTFFHESDSNLLGMRCVGESSLPAYSFVFFLESREKSSNSSWK